MRKTAGIAAAVLAGSLAYGLGAMGPVHAQPVAEGQAIVQTALQYVGKPYTATGTNPRTGFSDLGFVRYVYRQNGFRLHIHIAPDQQIYRRVLADGPRVSMADLQPGDILFFKNTLFSGLSHIGIYIGEGKFVHAEWYHYGVTVTSLQNDPRDGNYWATHYETANRPWAGM